MEITKFPDYDSSLKVAPNVAPFPQMDDGIQTPTMTSAVNC